MKRIATIIPFISLFRRNLALGLLLLSGIGYHASAQCLPISLPYFEGFEGLPNATMLPSCELGINVAPVLAPTASLQLPHSGSAFLKFINSPFFSVQAVWVTQRLNLTANTTYNFSFWYKTNATGWSMRARFDTTVGGTAINFTNTTLTALDSFHNVYNPNYSLATGSYVCTVSGPYRFGVEGYTTSGNNDDMLIDDVNIVAATASTGKPALNIQGPSSICPPNPTAVYFNLFDSANLYTSGIKYQWQSSPAGANAFVNVADTTNHLNATITASTDYRLIATDTATHLKDTSAIHTVSINPTYQCFCQPNTGTNLGGGGLSPIIDSVAIVNTSLHNQTYTALNNNYHYYPPGVNTTTTIHMGSNYTLALLMNTLGATGEFWIDFNGDGSYNPFTEYFSTTSSFLSYISTGAFNVPTGGYTGLIGMRIRSGGIGSSSDNCNMLTSGETEDYVLDIEPGQLNDLSALAIVQPTVGSSVCANASFTVNVQVHNAGSLPQTNFTVGATYPGNSTPIYGLYNGTLAPGGSANFAVGNMSIPAGGTYLLKAYTALSNDQNIANDTTYSQIVIVPLPADPIVHSDTVCAGSNDTISVTPVAGNVYNWYNAPSGGAVVYTGTQQILPGITNNTTYYVSASTPSQHYNQPGSNTDTQGCYGGVMFDITPNTNLTLDDFNVEFNHTGLQAFSVYYKAGSYFGNQTNSGVWYLLGSTGVQVNNTTLTYTMNVGALNLTNGSGYALYLAYDGKVSTNVGPFVGPDLSLNVTGNAATGGGTVLCGYFNNVNVSQQYGFLGSIDYHIGGSNCESNRVPITAAVGPAPVVNLGPDDTACYSPSLVLDAGNPGATYMWNTGATTRVIYPDTGSFTYTVLVTKYCQSGLAKKTVDVLPRPSVSGISYVRTNGVDYTFSAAGVNNVTGYAWQFGDGQGSNDPAPSHHYAVNTVYHVTLVVTNSYCGADTLNWTVPSTGVGNVASGSGNISVYPNPANTIITVGTTANLHLNELVIVNAIGQEVYRGKTQNSKTENIDISKLPAGNYILRATTADGLYNKLFQVVHQ
jgi:hypothetical protein